MIVEGDIGDAEARFSAHQDGFETTRVTGEDMNIRYSFVNSGRLLSVSLVQEFPEGMHLTAVRHSFLLRRERAVNISLHLTAGGVFRLPRPYVVVSDLFRMSARKIEFGEDRELTVLHSTGRSRTKLLKPLSYRMLPGNIVSRYAGSGSEFHSIAAYTEGQALRHINWKASARLDGLWVNEYISERSGTLLVIVDAKMIESDDRITEEFTERACFAASSIAYSALQERNAVGVMVLGERMLRIKPDYGFRQFQRISRLLASTGVSRQPSPVQIDRAVQAYRHSYAQYVVISPLADEETLDAVASLALNYRDVWAVIPLIFEKTKPDTAEAIAGWLIRLRQQNNATRLSRACRTLVWERHEDLKNSIGAAVNVRMRRVP